MPSSFDAADRAPPTVVTNGTPPLRASRLPSRLRVPILIVLNWGVQNALWSVAENFLDPELGAITRTENEWWSPYARLGYKVLIIFLGWYLRYDCKSYTVLRKEEEGLANANVPQTSTWPPSTS